MKTKSNRAGGINRPIRIFSFIVLFIFAVIFLVPLLWTFISAFKVDMEVHQAGGFLYLPKTWTLKNFTDILAPGNKQMPVYNWLLNSIVVSGTYTVLAILIFSMSAYAYAKMEFRGKNILFLAMLFMSTFPQIANVIPLYKLMLAFGWLNTPLALIVPGLAGMMNIFLIRQFLYGIPDSILESARMDGAGEFSIYLRFILPMAKPILVVVGLFSFTHSWNDFLWPSIAINNIDRLTLTPGLQLAKGIYVSQIGKMSAIAVIAIIPMFILYLFTQKHFSSGLSLQAGVKE